MLPRTDISSKESILTDYTSPEFVYKSAWKCPSNIAIVKYWGKYGVQLPSNPSISFTLNNAYTETHAYLLKKGSLSNGIEYYFDATRNEAFENRIVKFIEMHKENFSFIDNYDLLIYSNNSFPHSTGIASSAAAFGALALNLVDLESQVTETNWTEATWQHISHLARLGSGSASRSLYPSFVMWGKTDAIEGSSQEYAVPVKEVHENFQDIQDDILIVESKEKRVSSSVGHSLMVDHPYAEQRFKQAYERIPELAQILKEGNWEAFITLCESEALTLHSMMMCSKEYYLLFHPNTIQIINKIMDFRKESGLPLCFTLDAGPNIHLLYPKSIKDQVNTFVTTELKPYYENRIQDQLGQGPVKC